MVINGYKIRKYNNFGLPPGYAALLGKKFSQAQDRWFSRQGYEFMKLAAEL